MATVIAVSSVASTPANVTSSQITTPAMSESSINLKAAFRALPECFMRRQR